MVNFLSRHRSLPWSWALSGWSSLQSPPWCSCPDSDYAGKWPPVPVAAGWWNESSADVVSFSPGLLHPRSWSQKICTEKSHRSLLEGNIQINQLDGYGLGSQFLSTYVACEDGDLVSCPTFFFPWLKQSRGHYWACWGNPHSGWGNGTGRRAKAPSPCALWFWSESGTACAGTGENVELWLWVQPEYSITLCPPQCCSREVLPFYFVLWYEIKWKIPSIPNQFLGDIYSAILSRVNRSKPIDFN